LIAQGFSSSLVQGALHGGTAGVEALLNDLINGSLAATGDAQRAEISHEIVLLRQAIDAEDYGTQATILNGLTARWLSNHRDASEEEALAAVSRELGLTVDANRLTRDANGRLMPVGGTAMTTVFDDEGHLMPGVLNTQATPAEQARQLQSRLEAQGYSSDDASRVVHAFFHPEQVTSYLDQHDWTPDSSQVMSAAQELLARFPDMPAADAMAQARMLSSMNLLRNAPSTPSSEPPLVVVDRDGRAHSIDGGLLYGISDGDLQQLLTAHGLTVTDASPTEQGEPGDLFAQTVRPVLRVHRGRLMSEAQIFAEELAIARINNVTSAIRKLPGEENFQGITTVQSPQYIRGQRDVSLYEEYLRSRDPLNPILRPTSGVGISSNFSVLPESYVPIGRVINTSGFNITGRTNSAGFPRETAQYWREYARQFPEDLSPANRESAAAGRAPVIDAAWIVRHPEHARFTGEILIHHHLNQGPYAVPIPQSIHQSWFSTWHPLRGNDIQILRDIYKPKPAGK
jgi:HNH/Endo VII superfamily nuclease toxin with a HHH motif